MECGPSGNEKSRRRCFGGACALGLKALHLPVWAEASLTEAQVNDPINLSRTVSPKLIPLIKCAVIFRMVVVFHTTTKNILKLRQVRHILRVIFSSSKR
jgi:hypothetical protein